MEALYKTDPAAGTDDTILHRLDFGQYIAEGEAATLHLYYVPTDEFREVLRGAARLVVGRKGSGKTAALTQVKARWSSRSDVLAVDLRPEDFRPKDVAGKNEALIREIIKSQTR